MNNDDSALQNRDTTRKTKTSPQELERIEKGFLDGLESLRKEEGELVSKFGLKVEGEIFIDHLEENFSFKENFKRFLGELGKIEEQLAGLSGRFSETEVNQTLSRLRILKEKAQTLIDRMQQGEKQERCSKINRADSVSACKNDLDQGD
ncbi:MAG: hypothetical protein ABIC19_04035 [Patescibacteria group bacterium]|nr:hypothetical protein [Patescibacteria group bacterium]